MSLTGVLETDKLKDKEEGDSGKFSMGSSADGSRFLVGILASCKYILIYNISQKLCMR